MNLYEIERDINELLENGFNEKCVDIETGEIDLEKANLFLRELECERGRLIENLGLYIKNLNSDKDKIITEMKNLKERAERKGRKAEALGNFIKGFMIENNIPKFETSKLVLSFIKSKSVEIDDLDLLSREYVREKTEISADKTAIKKAILSGEIVTGAHIVENHNLQIK